MMKRVLTIAAAAGLAGVTLGIGATASAAPPECNWGDLTSEQVGLSGASPQVVNLSAKTGEGMDLLRTEIRRLAGYKDLGEGAFTARRRHLQAIETAKKHFERGHQALTSSGAGEIFAEELRLAQQALGEITGSFTSDDLLGKIFSEFCIGK